MFSKRDSILKLFTVNLQLFVNILKKISSNQGSQIYVPTVSIIICYNDKNNKTICSIVRTNVITVQKSKIKCYQNNIILNETNQIVLHIVPHIKHFSIKTFNLYFF